MIQMTRQQYQDKYGIPPPISTTPIKMTHAEYMAKYGNQTEQPKNLLQKGADLVDNTLGKAANFLFGSTAKVAGTPIVKGIGGATSLYGDITGNKKAKEIGTKLEATPLPSATDTAFSTLELYPGGGFVSGTLKKIAGGTKLAEGLTKMIEHIPEALREKAIKQYSEALGATTKELKAQTAKVVPTLLDRGVIATSLPKLEAKATNLMNIAGKAIKTAEEKIPETAMSATKPFISLVNQMKSKYIVGGKVFNQTAIDAIDKTAQSIAQYGSEISTRNLIKIRRLLDESVSIANKNFTKEEGLTILSQAQEEMANAMRNILNKDNPVLGAANKEFALWSNVKKIVKATVERKSTQSGGLTKIISTAGGAAAGFSQGQGTQDKLEKTLFYGLLGNQAIKAFKSPAWKTINAVEKNKLANYLASGKIKEANLLMAKLISGIKNLISE